MAAISMMTSVVSLDAHALALGRISVQSALGEALRAEIDITEINAAEAATLQASIASPETFKAAGVEFMPVLNGIQINLQRRANGQSFLRLTGQSPVTEPFVDLILEANWASGRVARDYTMLFDPPGMRSNSVASQPSPTAPMIARPNPAPILAPVAPERIESQSAATSGSSASRAPATAYSPPASPSRSTVTPKSPPSRKTASAAPEAGSTRITVQAGDTAGRIASQTKSQSVSLDQMLVALLRGNPDAFIGGNVNRIKSGAVLSIPTPEAAAAVSATEATQTITAQSVDFNAFRRKLAAGIQTTTVASADRQASGKVQAKVEDKAPSTAVPDKLTLSKGAVAGKPAAAEDKLVAERQARESSARVAELSKNISDLNKLGAASAAGAASSKGTPSITLPTPAGITAPAASSPTAPPLAPVSVPVATAAMTPAASAASATATPTTQTASQTVSPSASTGAASSPTPSVSAATAAAATTAGSSPVPVVSPAPTTKPPATAEPGSTTELLDNPWALPGLALLIALLGGFAFYRYKQRREPAQVDSSFLESRLQPDSFFGASGGQRVDTNESSVTGSSLVYSPSQLDAAGDVDPVAEADVYLAYGRDLQAEEILKEAMRTSPMRVAIHAKLMEIYAKRRDTKAFSMIATEAFKLTRGEGPEWAYISEMGRETDPGNPMYQPGGQPQPKPSAADAEAAANASANSGGFGSSTLPQAIEPKFAESTGAVDFDLDLDFSMDEPPPAKPSVSPAAAPQPPAAPVKAVVPEPMFDELIMDFGDSASSFTRPTSTPPQTTASNAPLAFESLNFTDEAFDAQAPVGKAPPKPAARDDSLVDFDMAGLSLDLDGPITESTPQSGNAQLEDPLETKFSLAQEFRSLGDPDGARALAEEVLLEATGPLKVKTQAFLNALS
jgi:pilus assembly protein FimV